MGRSLSAKRSIIGLIAIYAVLLHVFVAAAWPVAAVVSFGRVLCAEDAAASEAPADESSRRCHGFCCILACGASGFAFVEPACGSIVFATLIVSAFVFAKTSETSARSPLKFYFAARGPPQGV